jgi:hypothetical protein
MPVQKRTNFKREIEEHIRIGKESFMSNSLNQKPPNINKGKRKEQTVMQSTKLQKSENTSQ